VSLSAPVMATFSSYMSNGEKVWKSLLQPQFLEGF